jgi:hypothetical protein
MPHVLPTVCTSTVLRHAALIRVSCLARVRLAVAMMPTHRTPCRSFRLVHRATTSVSRHCAALCLVLPLCSATNASCRGHDVHASRCCFVPHRAPAAGVYTATSSRTVLDTWPPREHPLDPCTLLPPLHHAQPSCRCTARHQYIDGVVAPCPSAWPLRHLGRRPLARNRLSPGTPRAPLPCRLAPCCAPLLKHNRSCAPPVVLHKRHRPRARHVAGARPDALHRVLQLVLRLDLPDLEALLCTKHTSSVAPL